MMHGQGGRVARHGIHIDIKAGVEGGEKLENLRRELRSTANNAGSLASALGDQALGGAGRLAASTLAMLTNPATAAIAALAALTAVVKKYLEEVAKAQAAKFDHHLERAATAAKSYEVALGAVIKALERKAEIERASGLSDAGTQRQIGGELGEGAREAAAGYAAATETVLRLSDALQEARRKGRIERHIDQLFGGQLSIKELERRLKAAEDAQAQAYGRLIAADEALAGHQHKAQVKAAENAKKAADEQAKAYERAAENAKKAVLNGVAKIQQAIKKERDGAIKSAREKLEDARDNARKEVDAARQAADEKIKLARLAADEAQDANKALAEMPTVAQIGSRAWQRDQRAAAKQSEKAEREAKDRIKNLVSKKARRIRLSREDANMLRQARERWQAEQRVARAAVEQQAANRAAEEAQAKAQAATLQINKTLTELAQNLKQLLRQE